MKVSASRESLLAPLQSVMPYLGCLLALTVVAGSFVLKFGGKPQGD